MTGVMIVFLFCIHRLTAPKTKQSSRKIKVSFDKKVFPWVTYVKTDFVRKRTFILLSIDAIQTLLFAK